MASEIGTIILIDFITERVGPDTLIGDLMDPEVDRVNIGTRIMSWKKEVLLFDHTEELQCVVMTLRDDHRITLNNMDPLGSRITTEEIMKKCTIDVHRIGISLIGNSPIETPLGGDRHMVMTSLNQG